MNIFARAKLLINPDLYADASTLPVVLGWPAPVPPARRQYILRMLLRRPIDSVESPFGPMMIPPQLTWIQRWVALASHHQEEVFGRNFPYVYITVRHGRVASETDDVWHVDGFSMRKSHLPEQNYLYSSTYPTQFLQQRITIPHSFEPLRHNIQHYFQDHAEDDALIWRPPAHSWLVMDPYNIHRRPPQATGKMRTMVRITFVPVQIEDDLCTPNPLLPVGKFHNIDIRASLTRFDTGG